MRDLDDTLQDRMQWLIQHQLDGIYEQVRELRHIDGVKVQPSQPNVEAFIDKCIHNWLRSGDTFD